MVSFINVDLCVRFAVLCKASPHTPPQNFLSLCSGNHYQFDSLRRAKHSSMMVLYHLHNPQAPAFASNCNTCGVEVEAGQGWRCTVCSDFDQCNACYNNPVKRHPHELKVRCFF